MNTANITTTSSSISPPTSPTAAVTSVQTQNNFPPVSDPFVDLKSLITKAVYTLVTFCVATIITLIVYIYQSDNKKVSDDIATVSKKIDDLNTSVNNTNIKIDNVGNRLDKRIDDMHFYLLQENPEVKK
jgi:hypothetical protein